MSNSKTSLRRYREADCASLGFLRCSKTNSIPSNHREQLCQTCYNLRLQQKSFNKYEFCTGVTSRGQNFNARIGLEWTVVDNSKTEIAGQHACVVLLGVRGNDTVFGSTQPDVVHVNRFTPVPLQEALGRTWQVGIPQEAHNSESGR